MRVACCVVIVWTAFAAPSSAVDPNHADVEAAHAVFQKNLDAIARKDRAAYLACYQGSSG